MNNLNSTLAEEASNNNAPKRVKAKEIFLGIDVHLRSRGAAFRVPSPGTIYSMRGAFRPNRIVSRGSLSVRHPAKPATSNWRDFRGVAVEANENRCDQSLVQHAPQHRTRNATPLRLGLRCHSIKLNKIWTNEFFMDLTYNLHPEPTPEEQYRIIDPLIVYNEAQAGPRNKKDFAFSVQSETGEFVGGLLGFTHFNHFFVSALYVHQLFRKEGIGRELMKRAEALALEQGSDVIYLDTFDYQAPEFYEKLGFKIFGKLEDYPPGHQRFYLMKRIRDR
jgi:GNAT superfamily N-acetyltransferase